MKTKEKKHGIPALMSFFIPGLGQLIKGQVLKGFLIWLIPIVILMIIVSLHSEILLMLFIIGCIVLWLWNIFDAYNSNREQEVVQQEVKEVLLDNQDDHRWAMIIVFILLGGFFIYYFYHAYTNTAEEKEVKSALIEAYFDITSPHEKLDTKEGIPLFNTDITSMALYSDIGLVMLQAKNVQFEPKDIEVKCLSEDSANVAYDLQILRNDTVSKTENKMVLARKIGDRWKFDAKTFSPIEDNNSGNKESVQKHKKRKKEVDTNSDSN